MGPTREAVLKELRATARVPITLGKYEPQATIDRDGDDWVLLALVIDQAAHDRAYAEAMGPGGSGYWMPESRFAFLVRGEAIVRAATKEAFVAALEKITWSWS
ncbi:MAG TPA: hypothetical protein VGL86_26270 [Polyangia bacterium]